MPPGCRLLLTDGFYLLLTDNSSRFDLAECQGGTGKWIIYFRRKERR